MEDLDRLMRLEPAGMSPRDIYALMIDLIVPRPIALVSTLSSTGQRNLAPFSYFTGLSSRPPLVGLGLGRIRGQRKDTAENIAATGEFVISITTEAVIERAVLTSASVAPGVDEFELAGLTPAPSSRVAPPRVLESPVAMECRLDRIVNLHDAGELIIGEIISFHIDESLLDESGRVDPLRLRPVGRLGGNLYTKLGDLLAIDRPA